MRSRGVDSPGGLNDSTGFTFSEPLLPETRPMSEAHVPDTTVPSEDTTGRSFVERLTGVLRLEAAAYEDVGRLWVRSERGEMVPVSSSCCASWRRAGCCRCRR